MLGEHSPISKSARKKPAAAECEPNDDDDVEFEFEADSTPKKPNTKHNRKSPDKLATSRKRVQVCDNTRKARCHGIIKAVPKECLPQVPHEEQNWTITDKNERTGIRMLAKYRCFDVVKAENTDLIQTNRIWPGSPSLYKNESLGYLNLSLIPKEKTYFQRSVSVRIRVKASQGKGQSQGQYQCQGQGHGRAAGLFDVKPQRI